ncbi:MAG: hypothetical protein QM675_09440 [Protaetiibacter sp.]
MAIPADKKRVRELVGTLAWDLPEMNPRLGTLPPNPDGLVHCAEFEVLPGLRAVCFPDGDSWRGLLVQYDVVTGRVTSTMEHQVRAQSDEAAPRWAELVIYDILATAVRSATSEAAVVLPRERLAKLTALLERL